MKSDRYGRLLQNGNPFVGQGWYNNPAWTVLSFEIRASAHGQAREYGRITHFLQLPLEGHYFQRATVAQWLNRFQISGYQMKDMDTVFPLLPHGLL